MIKMVYDYGIKEIAKFTGLTGIEAKHVAQSLKKQNIDYKVIDWKTLGEDAYDYGKRTNVIWSKLGSMYGISKPETLTGIKQDIVKHVEQQRGIPEEVRFAGFQKEICMSKHLQRSPRAIQMDDIKKAKKRFKVSNLEGVQKWMKHPNRYDVIGIDFFPKKRRR